MARVAAVILAAGESSRLGKPKQLLEFEGKTMLRRAVDTASHANCSPVIVVTGSPNSAITRELRSTDAVVTENENWTRGIGSSIRRGVRRLIDTAPEVSAVVLLVCDQPFVNASTIQSLIALYERTRKEIVASIYANTVGVPAIFDRALFSTVLKIKDTSGAKAVILSNRDRVAEFPFPQGETDIDTVQDWQAL